MSLWRMLGRPRTVKPAAAFLAGFLAVVLASTLWMAGADAGAMKMLLVCLLFALASYGSYLVDPTGGEVSLRRGALVGGLTMLVWLPYVVCKHSYETRGVLLPGPFLGAAMIGFDLLFMVPFGAGVGGMAGVIGGRVLRATASIARPLLASAGWMGREKAVRVPSMEEPSRRGHDPLEWETW